MRLPCRIQFKITCRQSIGFLLSHSILYDEFPLPTYLNRVYSRMQGCPMAMKITKSEIFCFLTSPSRGCRHYASVQFSTLKSETIYSSVSLIFWGSPSRFSTRIPSVSRREACLDSRYILTSYKWCGCSPFYLQYGIEPVPPTTSPIYNTPLSHVETEDTRINCQTHLQNAPRVSLGQPII